MAKQRKLTKEEVYDSQINPLMAQIIDLCYEHKIALVAQFRLGDDLACTTSLLDESHEPSAEQLEAARLLYGSRKLSMLTVRNGEGKIVSSTAIVD